MVIVCEVWGWVALVHGEWTTSPADLCPCLSGWPLVTGQVFSGLCVVGSFYRPKRAGYGARSQGLGRLSLESQRLSQHCSLTRHSRVPGTGPGCLWKLVCAGGSLGVHLAAVGSGHQGGERRRRPPDLEPRHRVCEERPLRRLAPISLSLQLCSPGGGRHCPGICPSVRRREVGAQSSQGSAELLSPSRVGPWDRVPPSGPKLLAPAPE